MGRSFALWAYLAATARADRFASARLRMRVRDGQEPEDRAGERMGHASRPRPDGPLVWFHTSGSHAARHAQDIIGRLGQEREEAHFLVTTTSSSRPERIEPFLAPRTMHQYSPYETRAAVHRFLDHWQPDVAFWLGSELWPTLIVEPHKRGIPMYLVDARMSAETHYRWRWFPSVAASLLSRFRLILAADEMSALYLRRLGTDPEKVEVTGPLDEGTAALPYNAGEREWFSELLSTRPMWLAANVLPEEEEAVLKAHRRAARHAHRLLLILVPSDPARGPDLAEALREDGWRTELRSAGEEPDGETQVYVADTTEELGLWYRLSPITFLGTSLVPGAGGCNPYGPAVLGSAVIHGPNISDYPLYYARFEEASATRRVKNAEALGIAVEDLLMPDRAAELAHAAWEVSSRGAEVTDRIIELMHDALDGAQR